MTENINDQFQAQLFASHARTYGYAWNQKQSFNNFVSHLLPYIIDEFAVLVDYESTAVGEQHSLTMGAMTMSRPCHQELDGHTSAVLPEQARLRQLDYTLSVAVDVTHVITTATAVKTHNYRGVPLFELPVMVLSSVCSLTGIFRVPACGSDGTVVQNPISECPKDEGGYFIIRGNDRSLQMQETLAANRLFVFACGKGSKYAFVGEVRSRFETKMRSTSTLNVFVSRFAAGTLAKCYVRIPYLKCDDIPVMVVFRLLGITAPDEVTQLILGASNDPELRRHVEGMVTCPMSELEADVLYAELSRGSKVREDGDGKQRHVEYMIANEVLPHVGVDTGDPGQNFRKAMLLGILVRRLVRAHLYDTALDTRVQSTGQAYVAEVDDRDDYANKQLLGPGFMNALLLRQLFRRFQHSVNQAVKKLVDAKRPVDVVNTFKMQRLTAGLMFAYRTGNWSVQRKKEGQNVGVTQVVSRMSHLSMVSQMGRINNSSNRDGKVTHPRQAHVSHWGVVCPNETPEGAGCGFVKNLAIFAHVRVGTPRAVVQRALIAMHGVQPLTKIVAPLVMLNGDIVGTHPDPSALVHNLRTARRACLLPFDLSIVTVDFGVVLHCDVGCVLRPLLVIANLGRIATLSSVQELWVQMMHAGVIEYVSKDEEAELRVALGDDVSPTSTHLEISQLAILGHSVLHIPFANHNQAPRNIYQASMGKQAVAVPSFTFGTRLDAQMHIPDYTQHALVRTGFEDLDLAMGTNVIVAIMTLTGDNQEDSLIVNQAFLDRGGMRSTYYTTHNAEAVTSGTDPEEFERPGADVTGKQNADYSLLDADGRIDLETVVSNNTVLVGKTVAPRCKVRQPKRDDSIMYNGNDSGNARVHSVTMTSGRDGHSSQRVKLRASRVPKVGDKFCVTGDTEVLTTNGWVRIDAITHTHVVAVREKGCLNYTKPLQIYQFPLAPTDGLHHVGGPGFNVDLWVTSEHRLCVLVDGEVVLVPAGRLLGTPVHHVKRVANRFPNITFYVETAPVPADPVLALLARIVFFRVMYPGSLLLVADDHKPSTVSKLRTWAALVGGEIVLDRGGMVFLISELLHCMVHKSHRFPECVWQLSESQAQGFLVHLQLVGAYNLPVLADQLARLQVHAGKSGDLDAEAASAVVAPATPTTTNAVYCLSVPGEMFYIRRAGKCVWTGNSSRHGQKGTVGRVLPMTDMPFSMETGIIPDIVVNPCALPSRMTIAQLLECVAAKTGCLLGKFADGRAFRKVSVDNLCTALHDAGFQRHGNERLASGLTGEILDASIFMGPTYYQRLRHMTNDKIHSRASGPHTIVSRQPTEGRSNNGGLRMGEMERDCLVSYGASAIIMERFLVASDAYPVPMCRACGLLATHAASERFGDPGQGKTAHCKSCGGVDIVEVTVPYPYKLLVQELGAMGVTVRHEIE